METKDLVIEENIVDEKPKPRRGRKPKCIENTEEKLWKGEYIKKYKQEYYKHRRENDTMIQCPCGGIYGYHFRHNHLKTKFHRDFMATQNVET